MWNNFFRRINTHVNKFLSYLTWWKLNNYLAASKILFQLDYICTYKLDCDMQWATPHHQFHIFHMVKWNISYLIRSFHVDLSRTLRKSTRFTNSKYSRRLFEYDIKKKKRSSLISLSIWLKFQTYLIMILFSLFRTHLTFTKGYHLFVNTMLKIANLFYCFNLI